MVKAWKEKVTIPTYGIGKPEKNPMFLEKRVYQGSSGVVYPYQVIESISDTKEDRDYNAVWLENEYIKVMILPELGGRIQMAWDKIAKRHFIYYNHVIKPALVGLTGPWISGGIEFNWPQHHRPSTFMPVDSCIEQGSDGSVTVWVSERERMFHQKGMAGFTLRPGCAYIEIKGVLYNPTQLPQTFLWWANPAVHVNDAYQSVFPPDVNAVFDHGKRAVSTFPIATGVYYKMDYSAGVDISNYKNIPVPTSYMIADSKYDFEGGYENDTRAGMLHVANHHVSPGKKQWTWGNGDFGQAWDRNLTDEDGPYIELMAGVYTENQPDFSWLMPYEEKSFTQYFFPYRELGIVKNASRDMVLNMLPAGDGKLRIMAFATSRQECRVTVRTRSGEEIYSEELVLSPEAVYDRTIDSRGIPMDQILFSVNGLCCKTENNLSNPVPDPADPALKPGEIDSCEQLYLTGLHLEQYRHATWNAADYYIEALRRDPSDIRNNNALGLWYLRRARFDKAEGYLRKAVEVLTKRNRNPYDGEPIYNLALCLKYLHRTQEAYDLFYKASWNAAWQDAAYLACAQISAAEGRWDDALDEVNHSLCRNWHNSTARMLKAAVLRHLGKTQEAAAHIEESLAIDRFNFGCLFEKALLGKAMSANGLPEKALSAKDLPAESRNGSKLSGKASHDGGHTVANLAGGDIEAFIEIMRDEPHNYNELALDYIEAGLTEEAGLVWKTAAGRSALDCMSAYYCAHWCGFETAKPAELPLSFPNRLEAVEALSTAGPADALAQYLLGCLYYDKRQYDLAAEAWHKSAAADPEYPAPLRNLALYSYNRMHDAKAAADFMEKAFSLDRSDARILMELDQLYKKLQHPHAERLAFLQQHQDLVDSRDDLTLEEITLLNMTGQYREAMRKLDARIFHPWEGGEGKVPAQYQYARVELAKQAILEGRADEAIELLEECLVYPHNLGEGKLKGAQEQDFLYFLGQAYELKGNHSKAVEMWEKAAVGNQEPAAALYYNDAKPEKIFYQGLALKALGRDNEAAARFSSLKSYGTAHMDDIITMDYFAVSLPDLLIWDEDLQLKNRIHCLFMLSLGEYGLGETGQAASHLREAMSLDINHQGIRESSSIIL